MNAPEALQPDELFFSTTNARGIIEKANAVFVRLSAHPWAELVGAPHNIIRNDDMPAGAFRIMWDELQAGRPFCAYVRNLAANGDPYEVFATITPLGEGYLSVRSLPCATPLRDAAFGLYAPVRALEKQARAEGASASEAAGRGATALGEALAGAGFATYEDFQLEALPSEVAARAELAGPMPTSDGDGPLDGLLAQAHLIDGELAAWRERMDHLQELATALRTGAQGLEGRVRSSGETAEQVGAAGGSSPLMLGVSVWASMLPEIESALTELATELDELATSCAQTRFRIALAQLHLDATAQFVVELLHGDSGTGSGLDAIGDLARALDEGMVATASQAAHNAELANASATSLDTVRELLGVPHGLLAGWQEMVSGRDDDAVSRLVPVMADELAEGERASEGMAALAAQCREMAEPLDGAVIAGALGRIRRLAAEAADEPTPAPSRRAMDPEEPAAAPSRRALVDDEPEARPSRRGLVDDDEDAPVVPRHAPRRAG